MSMKNVSSSVIRLAHGAGGILQDELIAFITKNIILRNINGGVGIDELDDGATIPLQGSEEEVVISSDGHTVYPLFFPGGNLGILSACGTINDVIMMGARPIAMTSVVIIEEGFKFETLERIMNAFAYKVKTANVAIICGDTKVMPRGTLNEMIMATTGIGLKKKRIKVQDNNVQQGDKIIITGSIGDHGTALISSREGLNISSSLISDVESLLEVYNALIDDLNENRVHAMKDPTRGGLSGALNEWSRKSSVGVMIEEENIPIKKEVSSICDMLGLDPYTIASEGRALLAVVPEHAESILKKIRSTQVGKGAQVIGEVIGENRNKVLLKTIVGGTRIVDVPLGEPIPRIC
jgi:hydrogenase expression/formation protein HypE